MIEKIKKIEFTNNDIGRLENYLLEFTKSLSGILKEAISDILLNKGKRIRPVIFLISARNNNYDIDYLLPAAASIEIIHTASLIHDDIIDNSYFRRGKKTIHKLYSKDIAKFVGNYLFAHAFSLLNKYKKFKILEEMATTSEKLVRGEFDQIKTKKKIGQNENSYLIKINGKTISLFGTSCFLGGLLSDSEPYEIENLRKFGNYIGICFQIYDDLLDINYNYRKELNIIGKLAGNDVREGNITLPLIYALENGEFKKKAQSILIKDDINDEDIDKVLLMICKTDAIEKAKQKFNYYLKKAKKTIRYIGGKERRYGLNLICDCFRREIGKF